MPTDSDYAPLFTGTVYRSRVNDIETMSDSNAIGSFSIAELNTQYNNVVDLDEIQSRTFDADSDGIVRGFTDFSNTINTMDENHWLQVDSDGYGNNMLGDQLDFAAEYPGRRQGPIYSIGVSNLKSQVSIIAGDADTVHAGSGILEAQVSIVVGLAENIITSLDATLDAQASTVVATSERTIVSSGTLEAQVSTADGLSENTITASGILEAQVSTVDGLAVDKHVGSGTPEAQVAIVNGSAENEIDGSGILEAQVSSVGGASEREMPASGTLVAQVSTVDGTTKRTIAASGTPEAQVSTVDGLAVDKHIGSGTLEAQASSVVASSENIIVASGTLDAQVSTVESTSERTIVASGTLEAQVSTVDGLSENTITGSGILEAQVSTVTSVTQYILIASGTLEAQASTVDGLAENIITASGALQAQVSTVDGTGAELNLASGTLEAQASTVAGTGDTIEPYVGMPFPAIYVGMPFPEIYVGGIIEDDKEDAQGTLLSSNSEVDGVATQNPASGTLLSSSSEVDGVATQGSGTHSASGTLLSSSSEVDGLQPVILGTYYYDNLLGNDTTGDGSAASPWATVDKAINDGVSPGYKVIGIDNGPTNPYRINAGSSTVYLNDRNGTALNPMSLEGDPNSTAYLGGYPDRPKTQYPNTYITSAKTLSGWTLSSTYSNVWEVANPYPSSLYPSSALFGCSSAEWTADGIMVVKRETLLSNRLPSSTDPADLLPGEYYNDVSTVYYRPKSGENMSTRHFEFCDKGAVIPMKRVSHMTFKDIVFICSSGNALSTAGKGVNWEAQGAGNGFYDDWCTNITVEGCLFKYNNNATAFSIGEYYFVSNTIATDNSNNGIGFFGSKGDYPTTNRGFPVSNTLVQNCVVKRTRNNDAFVYHKNGGYSDPNNNGNTRKDDCGSNHKLVNCTASDNGENGYDITSGLNITLLNCVSHDNRAAGITVAHYARNVKIINHISYNDDQSRNFGGAIGLNDSRNVVVDNLSAYNPGLRSISIIGDAGNVTVKNSKFISGPDTDRSNVIQIRQGTSAEYSTQPRSGSTYDKQTPTSAYPVPYLNSSTLPERPYNLNIINNRFDIPFGGIDATEPEANYRFPFFAILEILPIQGYAFTLDGNVFRTSVLNTQWQPNTASDLPSSDYGPYKAKNSAAAVSTGGQPVINVTANQTYLAAGNFPTESDLWNFWPTGVTPIGRETYTNIIGEPTGVYDTASGFSTNDTQTDMPLYSSAHNISGQSTYWESATVQGINGDPALEYYERTTWTIAAPSTTATTSRAVAYIDTGFSNVSAQEPWSGDHRVSGGPLVCMNSAVSEFGLSFVWYSGASGSSSYLALFEVGQQPTDRTLKGISAPYPHTDGVEVRLIMEVEDGILRCYAGIRPDEGQLITPENQYSPTLIPLTTTEGGATFSETYDIATNNSNLNGSTTHGTYIYNNQVAASRTANLRYSVYPPVMRELT